MNIAQFISKLCQQNKLPDTDLDWHIIGQSNPYYGVITDDRFKSDVITEQAKEEFYEGGLSEIEGHLHAMRQHFGTFAPASALDFGCGVGRLTRGLATFIGDVVGVDVSTGMLGEARRFTKPGLIFADVIPDRSFDWLVSIIVFQHIVPERGYALLRQLLGSLALGGGVTLQFVIYRDQRHSSVDGGRLLAHGMSVAGAIANAQKNQAGDMSMFDYDLAVIVALLFQAGVSELRMKHTNHGGFHGVLIYGRKAADIGSV